MSNKPYKDFEPQWITTPPVEKSYRSVMKWGDPAAYKRPKEGLYKLIKKQFNLTDDDFKEMVDVGNEVVDIKVPSRLSVAQLKELAEIVGEDNVTTDEFKRVQVGYGKTMIDIMRLRKGIVRKPFSSVDREKLKNACCCLRDLALTEFLYASGLRVSEIISLDRTSIDFITREATVIGKGGKERRFYLSEVCAEYLRQYLNSRTDNNTALFVGTKSPHRRLTKEGVEYIVKDLGQKAGVSNVHPHRFRRTLATDLVRKGVPIQDVAQILGHSDLRTTQVYVALDQSTVKYHYSQAVA